MFESTKQNIIQIITELKSLIPKLKLITDSLKSKRSTLIEKEMDERGADYWRNQALSDSVMRVQIFIENNLSYIETLGVLALCRYTLELVVWLKHIEMDQRFALVYGRMLIKQQAEFYDDLANHLRREIDLYDSLAAEEAAAHASVLSAATVGRGSANPAEVGRKIVEDMQNASNYVDSKLALQFAIYSNDIKRNGYKFQAHIVTSQALPQALENAEKNRESLKKFNSLWSATIDELNLKGWKWNVRAAHVGMVDEYDFVYSYTSRLLHATPASLTTNQKNLEDAEALMFLRYINMQFRWITRHAEASIAQHTIH